MVGKQELALTNQKNDQVKLDIKIEILKRSTLLSCLDADQLKQLTPSATFRHFAKDEFIFHEGDPPNFLYIVGSGKVKQFKQSGSGKIFTAAIMSSGDPLNAVAMFGAKRYWVSAQAINDTTVLFIPRTDFLAFADNTRL